MAFFLVTLAILATLIALALGIPSPVAGTGCSQHDVPASAGDGR